MNLIAGLSMGVLVASLRRGVGAFGAVSLPLFPRNELASVHLGLMKSVPPFLFPIALAVVLCTLVLSFFVYVVRGSIRELHSHLDNLFADGGFEQAPRSRVRRILDFLEPYKSVQRATSKVDSFHESVVKWRDEVRDREQKHLEWLAYLSHDLSSPMHRIQARLHALEDPDTDETDRCKLLEAAQIESSEIVDVLGAISQMASLERGIERSFVPMQLDSFLKNAIEAFEYEARQKEVNLTLELEGAPPSVPVERILLRRAIENLVSNAIRHTPSGGQIVLGVQETNGRALIRVRDTGTGIPDDVISKIFEFAFQGDSKVRPAKVGSMGLGLAFVKMVAQIHRGEVTVRNLDSGGSEFSIYLPVTTSIENKFSASAL